MELAEQADWCETGTAQLSGMVLLPEAITAVLSEALDYRFSNIHNTPVASSRFQGIAPVQNTLAATAVNAVCKVLCARQYFVFTHTTANSVRHHTSVVRPIFCPPGLSICSSRKEGSGKECRLLPPRTDREPRTRQSYALQLRLGS